MDEHGDPGRWMADQVGVTLAPGDPGLRHLVTPVLRRNRRRACLPVSRVLGKHVPVDPRSARATGLLLGASVARTLLGHDGPSHPDPSDPDLADLADPATARDRSLSRATRRVPAVVLGYAENATALAQHVADALDADHVVASTRRVVPGVVPLGSFYELHSHAGRHLLLPDAPARWTSDLPMVLVDDEVSTGTTVAASLRLLHRARPRARYVLATPVDLRGPDDDAVERAATELGVRVDVVALARGRLAVPDDVAERAARVVADLPTPHRPPRGSAAPVDTVRLGLDGAPTGSRHGIDRAGRAAGEAALPEAVRRVADVLGPRPGRVLVLGTEELHYLPIRLAEGLADAGHDVTVAATTRSPVVAVDTPAYPIRSVLAFPAHDRGLDGPDRYAYDVGGRDVVVLVVDDDARTPALHAPGGLVDGLRHITGRVVEVAVPSPVPAPRPPS